MDIQARFRDRRVVMLTVLGIVTGIFSNHLYQLEPLWRELSVGVVFAVVMAAALMNLRLADPVRAGGFALLAILAWWLAERTTIQVFGWLDEDKFLSSAGLAGGLVGAAGLVAAAAVCFPWYRQRELWLLTIAVGGALGPLLMLIEPMDTGLVLFVPWQAAVAACLAFGFPPAPAEDEPD